MKKLLLVFLIALTLLADDKPLTGQDYQSWSESSRIVYVGGYLEGYRAGTEFTLGDTRRMLITALSNNTRKIYNAEFREAKTKGLKPNHGALCFFTSDVNVGQGVAILDKYLADHPERWDKPVRELAEEAFIDACEKRAKNP